MNERVIPPSELIINDDGSIFHLHLRPEELAETVVLVGDPGRVNLIAEFFDSIEFRRESREFNSFTGCYCGKRMTVLSTGIGLGNIDITMSELDALANIDLTSRTVKGEVKQLTIVRFGTSGALQEDLQIGDLLFARTSIGFDGVLSYYAGSEKICDAEMMSAFEQHVCWSRRFPPVYAVDADEELLKLFADSTKEGITIASPGFYAPQGRSLRINPADMELNNKIESFKFNDRRVTNYEMESSLIAGLAKLMGHRAATICTIIAQRTKGEANVDYKESIIRGIKVVLDKLAK
ncbi:MAG: nucleoside phosphorylase [Rikenellaceae bacterium]